MMGKSLISNPYFMIFIILAGMILWHKKQPTQTRTSLPLAVAPTEIQTPMPAKTSSSAQRALAKAPEKNLAQEKMQRALRHKKNEKSALPPTVPNPTALQTSSLLTKTPWKLWRGTHSQPASQSPAHDVIARIGNILIVSGSAQTNDLRRFNPNTPAVVYDPTAQQIGVVTGIIKVTTNQEQLLRAHLPGLQARFEAEFPDIETYYITGQNTPFDLEELYFSLQQLTFLKQTEVEIMSRSYEKR